MMRGWATIPAMLLTSACGAAFAADPPPTLNYQAVLWDAAGQPRTGTFDMTFRFCDPQYVGVDSVILVDAHTSAGGSAVVVLNGLVNVQLGGGTVTDGWGAGTYTSLADVFRDYGDVYMEITIGTETLVPMVKIHASAYAFNSGSLQGRPASSFLDTSATAQTKSAPLTVISTTADAVTGVSVDGAIGVLGSADYYAGVAAYGVPVGGLFLNPVGSFAAIANDAEGMQVVGQSTGGTFSNLSGSGRAVLASGNTGITAYGTFPGSAGHFEDRFGDGRVDLAKGNFGVVASGSYMAGRFTSFDAFDGDTSLAELGSDNWGAAGFFHWDSGSGDSIETLVATETGYGVATNHAKDFVQNHPTDPGRVIAFSVLEGPEAGTYTRGSGAIRGGEARIALEPTFALTTNPEIGLTAVVTPRRPRADLYVAFVSTNELVVRSGSPSAEEVAFDYVVNGLRVGFENQPVIVESHRFPSATVRSLEASAEKLAALPEDARASTPLARLAAERTRSGLEAKEMSGAGELIAGINSSEHALHARPVEAGRRVSAAQAEDSPKGADVATVTPYTFSMPIEMEVEPGDVVASDATAPGSLRLAEEAADPPVIGVVVGPAGRRFRSHAPIALAGTVVPCNVDASNRPIAVSDLLVASRTPGLAISAGPDPRGAVIGKALEPLAEGTGSIRILVLSR